MDAWLPTLLRVGRGASAKLGADVLGRLLQLGLFVVAARSLSAAEFGAYAWALAVGVVLGQLADAGLQLTLLRRLSAGPMPLEARRALGEALAGRTLVAVPLALAGMVLVLSLGVPRETMIAAAAIVLALVVTAYADLFAQVLRAAGRLPTEAGVTLLARLGLVAGGCAALLAVGSLPALAAVYLAIAVAWPAVMAMAARRSVGVERPGALAPVVAALREALPVGLAIALSLLAFRIDVPILGILRDAEEVGTYQVAYRVFEAALLVPVAVMAAVFPILARSAVDGPAFRAGLRRWGAILAGLGLLAAVAGWLLGPPLIELAFGAGYADAGAVLRVLVLCLPPLFVSALLSQALVALGRPWRSTAAFGLALAVNVAVNLALIPALGAQGAAWATVAAEVALLAALLVTVRGAGPRPVAA